MTRPAGSSRLLRTMNASAALAHLLDPGMLTRADLRKLTALSTPTISEVLRRLTEAGLVTVAGHDSGRPGPSAEIYNVNPEAAYAAAVSVRDVGPGGAPSVVAALCDLTGQICGRAASSVDFAEEDTLTALSGVLDDLYAGAGVAAGRVRHVQLGVPGSYDPRTETIHHVDVPGLGRTGLVPELAAALRTEVGVDNDVNLAAIAERRRGVGRDTEGFALLWLGEDGLGLAIDLAGTLMRGARGGAGEIGYMPLYRPREKRSGQKPAGDEQPGGKPGGDERAGEKRDLHDLIAGPALLGLAREHGLENGRTATEVVRDARGDLLTEIADRIAVGVAAVIAVLDPHLVVLAGPIAQAGGVTLLSAVRTAMRRAAPLESEIAVTAIDDDAVLLGALDAGLTAVHNALLTDIRNS
ncbi:ROK family transcriptional regulator [Paractinoplanes atraurantiacus]|uniref:Sugar kinase of the NBD/HSP70 family, may contain an N-terminal HTH domain n=1 Tax=Paractinoplanes atraurantiacus TaxID=1036182 RepID=A0A285HF75_9ACTN|nr:ROK family transcriptional regulator [Actinoplanes atraurantiacus]SNY33361.1 Sugar kinase of the NBD/HSP70 family, may contain an N-terminal HTH domain [Actinoplanes atraurantiacus]